jgi:hypothetical protein
MGVLVVVVLGLAVGRWFPSLFSPLSRSPALWEPQPVPDRVLLYWTPLL